MCVSVSVSVSIPLLMDTWLLPCPGCCKHAAVSTGRTHLSELLFPLVTCRSGIAGSQGNSVFNLFPKRKEEHCGRSISILCSTVAVPISIPTNSVGGFPFLHTLSSIIDFLMMAILIGMRWYFILALFAFL